MSPPNTSPWVQGTLWISRHNECKSQRGWKRWRKQALLISKKCTHIDLTETAWPDPTHVCTRCVPRVERKRQEDTSNPPKSKRNLQSRTIENLEFSRGVLLGKQLTLKGRLYAFQQIANRKHTGRHLLKFLFSQYCIKACSLFLSFIFLVL